MTSQSMVKNFSLALPPADVLLVVSPFQGLEYPSLAAHLLQACGRKSGFRVSVFYSHIFLASVMGERLYTKICCGNDGAFLGERLFARCAFSLPPLGFRPGRMFDADWVFGRNKDWEVEHNLDRAGITLKESFRLESFMGDYVEKVSQGIHVRAYRIVGCSTSFEQTAASIALLNRIKELRPDTITILGGANCEGDMAIGIASLSPHIDFVFSGESESAFVDFVHDILSGSRPPNRVFYGKPTRNLDALPTPNYEEFYQQGELFLGSRAKSLREPEIPYETSRGCWWGQKHHCTFCGFNTDAIVFRQKSPDRVIGELRVLSEAYPGRKVRMTDSVFPYTYFETVLPRLAHEFPGASIFYETRANLSLPQVLALKKARVTEIQPGIESLSSRLLRLMDKGVLARQNLILLRNAAAVGIDLIWNLLWGIPGDDIEDYLATLALIPLLHHLQPPTSVGHISIDRFSPYFSEPRKFRIRHMRPIAGYYDSFPTSADIARIAYAFIADYRCGSHDHPEVICRLSRAVRKWQNVWRRRRSTRREMLKIFKNRKSYVLVDTRALWKKKKFYRLDDEGASFLLSPRPSACGAIETWSVRKKLAVIADGWFVPLPTADPELMLELTRERREAPLTQLEPSGRSRAGITAPWQ